MSKLNDYIWFKQDGKHQVVMHTTIQFDHFMVFLQKEETVVRKYSNEHILLKPF